MFFLFFKGREKEKTLRVIFYYIVYCIINEAIGYYLHEINKSDFILFALYTLLEFTFFSLFYYYALPKKPVRKVVPIMWALFFIFECIDFFLINQMNAFDSFAVGVESILIILLCIYYLVIQLKGTNTLFVYSTFNFWVIITFLIYLSGTLFLYVMAENMIQNREFRIQYIVINSVFNVIKNILLSIAMLMKPTPIKNPEQKDRNLDEVLSYNLKN